MTDRNHDGDVADRILHGAHVDVVLGGIDLLLAREDVETRSMEDGLFNGVALAAIVGADAVALVDGDAVAGSALTTC